ncbi:MAG TPA: hypothetical protein VGU46_10825 [Acidobacteriaceae bacterium]|nr:hypothetical protein [Acidobacteriaceae bacterium]
MATGKPEEAKRKLRKDDAETSPKLTTHKPSLRDVLLGGPKVGDFDVTRDKDVGREIDLE